MNQHLRYINNFGTTIILYVQQNNQVHVYVDWK